MTEIAVYYFPGWHADTRCSELHGEGWTEWELLRRAEPRFAGHEQPIQPQWGEFDEADPGWAERQVELAADHGVTSFLFDWYWYNGPFLNRALDQGFLHTANRDRLKFALMWANHDWINLQPASLEGPRQRTFDGTVSSAAFVDVVDHIVSRYFSRTNYLTIGGDPYFSIYDLGNFVRGMGGLAESARALDLLRTRARQAGRPGVHLNVVAAGIPTEPCDDCELAPEHVAELGFDSVTSYVWVHHFDIGAAPFPAAPYASAFEQNERVWGHLRDRFGLPYHPNVTVGWDSTPRTLQSDRFERRGYPWLPVLVDNTPELFADALERALDFVSSMPVEQRMITINAWNEWTEGSYLLPDRAKGNQHLEAIERVTTRHAARA